MMTTEVLYLRVPSHIKREIERLAATNDLTLSTAARIVFRLGLDVVDDAGGLFAARSARPAAGPEGE